MNLLGYRKDIEYARSPRRSPEEHEEKLARSAGMLYRLFVLAIALWVLAAGCRALGIAG